MQLILENLCHNYRQSDGTESTVVDIPSLSVAAGSRTAFTGPSGAGKTTLLYLSTGIEKPRYGRILWNGLDLASLPEKARDTWRRHNVGIVFQDFHLVPGLSVIGNVLLPASFGRIEGEKGVIRKRALDLLDRMEVPTNRRSVDRLSRGEKQRVAISRALLFEPDILVADEPTASLDSANAESIMDILEQTLDETGATFLLVTHDPRYLERMPVVHHMDKGQVST